MEEKVESKLEIIKDWYNSKNPNDDVVLNFDDEEAKNLFVANILITFCSNSDYKGDFELILDVIWPESNLIEDFFKQFRIMQEDNNYFLLLKREYDDIVDEQVILNWKMKTQDENRTVN